MKKIFYVVLTVFAGLIFMSSSPSLDGRAVVADSGMFPAGLFAKTVGYLPGDSISVTNPSNGQNIEILVIGSLDPSEGVAVMLSPEAADCLGIKKNSNMLVKLTKRSGELDENANGSCVLTQSRAPVVEETKESEEIAEETDDSPIVVEDDGVVSEDEIEDIAEEETEDAIPEEETEEDTPIVVEDDYVVPEEEGVEEDAIPEEETEEDSPIVVEDDYVVPEEEGVEEDAIPEEETEEASPIVVEDDYVAPEEEGVDEDEIPEEDKPSVVDDTYIPEEEGVEEDEIPEEDKPVIVDDAVIPEEEGIEEDELPPEEEIAEETEEEIPEETEEEDFDAIVLVPSDENPPEAEESVEEEIEEPAAPAEESVIADIEELAPVEEPEPVAAPVVEPAPVEKEFDAPVEVTSGTFEKGKWYIQIGVYAKQENVNEIIKKYGKKYPLFIDQKNGKNYVLIGPLSMDEYGAVLQRFKAFGYKDAFVKKIK